MKILVAVDGSKHALHALEHVISVANQLKEAPSVTLICVHDDVALRSASRFVGKKSVDDYLAELSREDLKDAQELAQKAGYPVDTITRVGHVAQEIANAASAGGFDLLVVGAKGRGSLKDILIGSVASRLAEMSKVPLLLVK